MIEKSPIFLHVGMHKTATTSLQKTLHQNQTLLEAEGFHYGQFSDHKGNSHFNLSEPFIVAFSPRAEKYETIARHKLNASVEKARYREQLAENLARLPNLIFSGEGISNLPRAGLEDLAATLKESGRPIHVVCVIRSPYSFSVSVNQGRVKHGNPLDFSFIGRTHIIEVFRSIFPDIKMLAFGVMCRHRLGPVGFMLEELGIKNSDQFEISEENTSLSDQAVRLIGHLNNVAPTFTNGKFHPLRRHNDIGGYTKITGDKFLYTDSEFRNIEKSIEEENKKFSEVLGKDFCDEKIKTRERPAPWSEENFRQLKRIIEKSNIDILPLVYSFFHASDQFTKEQKSKVLEMIRPRFFNEAFLKASKHLKDNAVTIEGHDIASAYAMMELAQWGNPHGPVINKKLNEYREKLEKN